MIGHMRSKEATFKSTDSNEIKKWQDKKRDSCEVHSYTSRFLPDVTCSGIVAVTNVGDDFLVDKRGLMAKWSNVHLVFLQCSCEGHLVC